MEFLTECLKCKGGKNSPNGPCLCGVNHSKKHNHYFKDVQHLSSIDVYRVLQLYNVTDACLQHAIKKLLVAGGRGAGKDINQDIQEAIDTLNRWKEIQIENKGVVNDK